MSATANSSWMLATILVTLLIAVAAMFAERAAIFRRGTPLRWIWVSAMSIAFVYSCGWLLPSIGARNAERLLFAETNAVHSTATALPTTSNSQSADTPLAGARSRSRSRMLDGSPPMPANIERAFRALWIATSVAMSLFLLWSIARLARQRRSWRQGVVHDTPVLIADDFGPAIVGVLRPAIVIPPWVLALDTFAQRTVLLHEREHQRAGDPRLLLGSVALLVLMPWNVGLWFMWRRLNRAIELDCDQRVLAHGVAGADYARVLLSAWQHAHGVRPWAPSPAFAERTSWLGRRVEHLMRPTPRRWIMKTLSSSFVAVIFASAVSLVPRPQQAQRATPAAPPPPPTVSNRTALPAQVEIAPPPPPSRRPIAVAPRVASAGASERVTTRVDDPPPPPPPVVVQRAGRVLLLPMDEASLPLLEGVRSRLAADSAGNRPLVLLSWNEAKSYLIASGYLSTPMYHTARDLRALSTLMRADVMLALSTNERAGTIRMEATVGSASQFRFYDFKEDASQNGDPLIELLSNTIRADSMYIRMRRP